MKIKITTDIQLNKQKLTAGSEFDATDSQAEILFRYGWAEAVEEVKAPKAEQKKPAKKTAKK